MLDRYDIGDSAKLGRAVAPVYEDGGTCIGYTSRAVEPPCPEYRHELRAADELEKQRSGNDPRPGAKVARRATRA